MAIPIDDLIQTCINQKYFIVVQKDDNGVSVSYPRNCIISPTFESRVDTYKNMSRCIEYANSDGHVLKVKTSGYDNRILILTDIIIKTKQRGISAKLILPFDGLTPKQGIVGLMAPCKNKVLKTKEDALIAKYGEIINVKSGEYTIEHATKDKIVEGFNSIRALLDIGGF